MRDVFNSNQNATDRERDLIRRLKAKDDKIESLEKELKAAVNKANMYD